MQHLHLVENFHKIEKVCRKKKIAATFLNAIGLFLSIHKSVCSSLHMVSKSLQQIDEQLSLSTVFSCHLSDYTIRYTFDDRGWIKVGAIGAAALGHFLKQAEMKTDRSFLEPEQAQ